MFGDINSYTRFPIHGLNELSFFENKNGETVHHWRRRYTQQKAHGPHRWPKQFQVSFYFLAYAVSILIFEPLPGAQILVRGLWLILNLHFFRMIAL